MLPLLLVTGVIGGTAFEPVTLPEAKQHCRVLSNDEDTLITALITAAREWVENFTGHLLVPREVTQRFECFSSHTMLYGWPIADSAVPEITYADPQGEIQMLVGARIALCNGYGRLAPAFGSRWPSTYSGAGSVVVKFQAGYATPAAVPQSMKQAILLLVGHWFANRESVSDKAMTEVPMAVDALCRPYRMVLIG